MPAALRVTARIARRATRLDPAGRFADDLVASRSLATLGAADAAPFETLPLCIDATHPTKRRQVRGETRARRATGPRRDARWSMPAALRVTARVARRESPLDPAGRFADDLIANRPLATLDAADAARSEHPTLRIDATHPTKRRQVRGERRALRAIGPVETATCRHQFGRPRVVDARRDASDCAHRATCDSPRSCRTLRRASRREQDARDARRSRRRISRAIRRCASTRRIPRSAVRSAGRCEHCERPVRAETPGGRRPRG